MTSTQKENAEKDNSEKIKLQFPYVVRAQYEPRITADAHLQCNCAWLVHESNINIIVALNA